MGFDNECILNIQSLPGEYFCPVCRTLIYPNEAVQTQCTHLYCKPCLAYVVATTKACPYDGYLVTETDSKPVVESNKPLAETIGKVMVHCMYNKSGCQWQGTLSACITHGTACAYGNSPVVCNRCGIQIVHRQVQEHAQLCPGMQSQTQQADGNQAQPLTGTAQAVTKDPAIVSSVGSAAALAATVPAATTATAMAASSVATGGSASASTSAPQASTAEHWYQQQYSQYYQQYPGYNPYAQQYQQYGQYQQAYQQYTQPQMQVASQNAVQASVQSAQVMLSSQPQQMTQSQPQSQHQAQLQTSAGYPQTQQHQVQPQTQIQPSLPHLQAPAGQTQPQQPVQSAYQVLPMQQQSQVPLQLPAPQAQPTVHYPASTQVGSQQFAVPSSQATPHQIQPNVQAQPPQQQHIQHQALPQQQNLQPQMQLSNQIQHQPPQVPQQSQTYPQPTPHMHPQNTSYPQQQMPPVAPLQQPVHASHQQGLVSQHSAPMCPPLPGQQLAMLPPQGIQHTSQHQQHAGYHAQRPPTHSSIPSQAPQQGLSHHPSQADQSYQQGMSSTQQQMHSHPLQPYGPPYAQAQHVPGYAYTGQHIQTSASRPVVPAAPPQQFKPQSSGPLNNLQTSVMNKQPSMLGVTDTGGQPTGQGSLASETQSLQTVKSENASGVAHSSASTENRTEGAESSFMKPSMAQSLNDERMNGELKDFGSGSKDERTGVALDSADISIGKDGIAARANSHAAGLHGGKEHKSSDPYNNLEKGGSVQQASQKNAGPAGAYPPPGMGPQHPFEPDRMFHQHRMNSGPMPYNMQGQPNQIRPPKHSFAENTRPPMQQPYDTFNSGMTQRTFGENQIQSPMPHPAGIRPGDGMVRPPVGPFPGHHDTLPPFIPDPLGRPHPPGTLRGNGVGGGPFVSGRAFHEEGFNTSGEHFRSLAAHPGRHNVNHNDIEDLKQFPGPAHLELGPNSFESTLGRHDGFPGRHAFANEKGPFPIALHEDFSRRANATAGHPNFLSPSAEFDHHGTDGMPNLRNPGPFVQGMIGGPGGVRKDFLGSVNRPGNAQHAFDGPAFAHAGFHHGDSFPSAGHVHPDDRNLVADYTLHGFAKEPGHFGLGALMRNSGAGWCRICMLNCGSVENLDLHVQTREHQQCAMDLILKMKQDVTNAKRQKLNHGGSKSFHNKRVAGKGHFRGNKH